MTYVLLILKLWIKEAVYIGGKFLIAIIILEKILMNIKWWTFKQRENILSTWKYLSYKPNIDIEKLVLIMICLI